MTRRALIAVWVWWVGIGGSLGVVALALLLVPRLWGERREALDWHRQAAELAAQEDAARQRLESARETRARFDRRLAELEAGLASASFVLRHDSEIPQFIRELQALLTRDATDLSGLAWQSRRTDVDVEILPFSARFEADFAGFMRILAALENHPSRLRIDSLEFHSLDNARHLLSVTVGGSARFVAKR